MKQYLDRRNWLKGLAASVIGGVASAGGSWMGMATAHYAGLEVPTLNFKALGIICLSSGLVALFAYLKQPPIPKECGGKDALPADTVGN